MKNVIIDGNSKVDKLSFIGGKGHNLYLLENEGLPIPKWFCISSELFHKAYMEVKDRVKEHILKIDLNDLESLKKCSEDVDELFQSFVFPTEEIDAIKAQLNPDKFYAIRSSALDEDGRENSYAGQLSSFLFMGVDDIEKSIKSCWASVFSYRNIQYRLLNEIHESPRLGVIVQEMVDAKKSGVMFTCHPLLQENFLDKIVINAGFGVGEGIVSDQVETDTYIFSKSQKSVVHTEYNEKKVQMIRSEDGGVTLRPVDPSVSNISVLTNNEILKLSGLGLRIREFYGIEQDIEWCIDLNGKFYITQSRPITTIEKGIQKVDFFFDNSNVVESFPGVNTPWTLGQIRDIYSISFRKACLRIGLSRKKVNLNFHLFNNLIGIHQGRIFYNLTNWYSMMRFLPFTERYIKVWEEMLGVDPNTHTEKENDKYLNLVVSTGQGIKIFFNLISIFGTLNFKLGKLDKSLTKLFREFWEEEAKGVHIELTPAESIERIETFKSNLFHDSELTLINDIYAFLFSGLTKSIIKNSTNLDADQTFNDLLYGISGMDSIKPLNGVIEISKYVKNSESLYETLKECEALPSFNIKQLKNLIDDKKFIDLFNEYIDTYGDRGVDELKLETMTYREDPRKLLRLILSYCDNDFQNLFQDENKRIQAENAVRNQIKSNSKRGLYLFFLKMAKRSINYRENFRLHRSRAYGILRRMTNNLGHKMKAIDDIDKPRDIYFLDKGDLYHKYSGLAFNSDLKNIVKSNKLAFQNYEQLVCKERYTLQQGKFKEFQFEKSTFGEGFKGIPCSGGKLTGEVLVINDLSEVSRNTNLARGKILVAKMTDPGWVFMMAVSKGLIVEKGSILSHTAIIGRELGIPTIVGVKGIVNTLKTGDYVQMDANSGEINLVEKEDS